MDLNALGLHWDLEPGLRFLNHGSFGLAPRELLRWRFAYLQAIERDPVRFLVDQLPDELARARAALAQLVGAEPAQLAFVPSTTYGLNQLLQRLDRLVDNMPPGSEILLTNHSYNATLNLVHYAAERHGWCVRQVPLPLPLSDPSEVVDAFAQVWTARTRLLLIDHITSPSALVLPLRDLILLARSRSAAVIVDGAHAPGSLPIDLQHLQPDAYVGNLHKWMCCPRGAAFLWVARGWREKIRPLVISHGANAPAPLGVSRFQLEHDWIGTADPTPWLALPEVLHLLGASGAGGLEILIQRHHRLAQEGQTQLLAALGHTPLAPASCQAAMAAVPLPPSHQLDGQALQRKLLARGFQVPVIARQPHLQEVEQYLRISCFVYNTASDVIELAEALPALLSDAAT